MTESIRPTVPNTFDNRTMYLLLHAVLDEKLEPKARKIELDFTALDFIEPVGVTVLCNILQWLWIVKGVNFTIHCNKSSRTIRYLDDSGFFKLHLGEPLSPTAEVRATTVPLELVSFEHSHQYINDRFSGWLQNRLKMNKDSIASILMSISEIFINIQDHSGRGAVEFSLTDGKIQPKSLVIPGNFEIFYPGTLFSIILRTDTIEHVTAEEEFTW